ncbi:MAG: hypothetical protein WC438_05990 [Candidatus Pacearchaeota archaeon]|jgi:hypothetical protein
MNKENEIDISDSVKEKISYTRALNIFERWLNNQENRGWLSDKEKIDLVVNEIKKEIRIAITEFNEFVRIKYINKNAEYENTILNIMKLAEMNKQPGIWCICENIIKNRGKL